ncbi:MAG: endopeptidase La [Sphaerochaetaceae bacterium]|nr:endopeptidase La [Sphaerochaetaceae bacterium]
MSKVVTSYGELPENIFIIPMRGCPVFPGLFTTIEVSEPSDMKVVKNTEPGNGFGLLLLKNEEAPSRALTADDFYTIGTFVKVRNRITTLYGTQSLYLETVCRFRTLDMVCQGGIVSARVEYIEEEKLSALEEKALFEIMRKEISMRPDASGLMNNIKFNAGSISNAIRLADYLASTIVDKEDQQSFLEDLSAKSRMYRVIEVLKEDLDLQKLQHEIQGKITSRFDKRQREYYLREELKTVKEELNKLKRPDNIKELSSEDLSLEDEQELTGDSYLDSLSKKIKKCALEPKIHDKVMEDFRRMADMDTGNPEYSVLRTYLETVVNLPWNNYSKEKYSIENARKILERDHYGIKDVKERILEFLAVRKLKGDTKGSIICLIGPPGTGKTSVGISIAKALNKKYYRFSVGGMRDEAEIKGHRRTYIGAMPGQIIKGLQVTGTKNPVFVIDEIDKMTSSYQGDPASALLEVLDPEQNTSFRDHYLDLPFDASSILFIVTANTADTIPRPLLDRMECIELNGYTSEEKLHIGRKYLVPKSREKHGLTAEHVHYPSSSLKKIAEEYAREAGVRNFEKAIDKINRKVAMEIVMNDIEAKKGEEKIKLPVEIDSKALVKYLGQPVFREDEIIRAEKPGMAVGLAWTSMGGDVLAIEAQHIPGKGELKLTGQLGDVMKESATIAFSYIKSICEKYSIPLSWFEKNSVHLHVPEGATPKDGPSAGITMATAMFSLLSGKVIKRDLAMTGELSLMGKVMPIGGLKEKVLAAKRNKVKTIIIPKFNQRDLDKLDDNVKKGVTFLTASDMEEVLAYAFTGLEVKDKNEKN